MRGTSRVRVEFGGRRVVVPVVNGTYLAQVAPLRAEMPVPLTITAFDADGRVVAELTGAPAGCYTTPDGEVVYGARESDPTCTPAVRWP